MSGALEKALSEEGAARTEPLPLGLPPPLRRLGILSVALCLLAALVAGVVWLLTFASLAHASEGLDFDDPAVSARVAAVIFLIAAGGVLALVSAGAIYWYPRTGAVIALVAAAAGMIAFFVPPFASPAAVSLWVPDTVLLVAASAVGFVRQRRLRADMLSRENVLEAAVCSDCVEPADPPAPGDPVDELDDSMYDASGSPDARKDVGGRALGLGIAGILLSLLLHGALVFWVGPTLAVVGFWYGASSLLAGPDAGQSRGMAKAGVLCGLAGLLIGAFFAVLTFGPQHS